MISENFHFEKLLLNGNRITVYSKGDDVMKNRWLIGFMMLLLLSVSYMLPGQVHAKAALHVEAEIGIDNRVKQEMPTFLDVTITNNGEDFSGDFVVDAEMRYNMGSAIVLPLDIAAGETKTMKVYLDGFSDRYMYTTPPLDLFYFYEGGIEKGKEVDFEGDKSVNPRVYEAFAVMGLVATTRQDEVSTLDRIETFVNSDMELFYVNNKNHTYLADDARALSMLNYMVFDDIAVHDLSEKQQQALYEWVQQGGTILFAPNELGNQAAGVFADSLPLTLTNEKVQVPVEELKKYVTANADIPPIMVYKATLVDGAKEQLGLDGSVIAGVKPVGKGEVIQFTFPLNDPVISKLSGYGTLMKDIFGVDAKQNAQYGLYKYGSASEWVSVNELFETFRINVWLLMGGIVIYIALIGPVLYLVLKRKDKREKMWLYVPIIAVLTSLLFFVFGARDRLFNPQIQQMALYEVQEDGTLTGTFTNALLSNRTGDFKYKIPEGTSSVAINTGSIGSSSVHLKSYVKETAEGQELTLRNMDYWSVQSMVGETILEDAGTLTADLTLENKQLTGTITNGLPVDLQDVAILTGNDEIVIDSIKAGETLQVNQEVDKQFLAKAYYYDPYGYGYYNQQVDVKLEKIERFKGAAIMAKEAHNGPVLVGWSDVSLVPATFDGNAKQQTMSYFVAPIQPNVVLAGELTFTEEHILPYMESVGNNSWGNIEENDISRTYLGDGDFDVYYDFIASDEMKKLNWTELAIKYDKNVMDVELYNHETKDYVKLDNGAFVGTEDVKQFVEEESQMQLKFRVKRIGMDDGNMVQLPTFTLKGEPKQ